MWGPPAPPWVSLLASLFNPYTHRHLIITYLTSVHYANIVTLHERLTCFDIWDKKLILFTFWRRNVITFVDKQLARRTSYVKPHNNCVTPDKWNVIIFSRVYDWYKLWTLSEHAFRWLKVFAHKSWLCPHPPVRIASDQLCDLININASNFKKGGFSADIAIVFPCVFHTNTLKKKTYLKNIPTHTFIKLYIFSSIYVNLYNYTACMYIYCVIKFYMC